MTHIIHTHSLTRTHTHTLWHTHTLSHTHEGISPGATFHEALHLCVSLFVSPSKGRAHWEFLPYFSPRPRYIYLQNMPVISTKSYTCIYVKWYIDFLPYILPRPLSSFSMSESFLSFFRCVRSCCVTHRIVAFWGIDSLEPTLECSLFQGSRGRTNGTAVHTANMQQCTQQTNLKTCHLSGPRQMQLQVPAAASEPTVTN